MMIVLLIAGIGAALAGLLAIAFGIPIKEFGFGNTLILVGVVAVCTGMILLGLSLVVRELKIISQRLRPAGQRARTALPSGAGEPAIPSDDEFSFGSDPAAAENAGHAGPGAPMASSSQPPWHEEAASRDRVREGPEPAPARPPKPRRNLLFSSTSRKERERAEARTAESAPVASAAPEPADAPPATFDDAWPKSARGAEVPPQRRGGRAPSTLPEANGAAPDRPAVTVLKSGVVDGMAYSLYSDGSIEAQMPEGMMRFASIDELRAHLEQRP
jgi:hypothetical protein